MATTPRDRLQRQKDKVRQLAEEDECSEACRDALLEFAEALDPNHVRHKYIVRGSEKTLKPRSIEAYLRNLRICVEDGFDPLNAAAAEFNDLIDRMHDEEGKAKTTLQTYQAAAEAFYRYHDFGVAPDDIHNYTEKSEPRHDERDMFTEEEIDALRQACAETQMTTRNRALLELLIFTGQRLSALLTLRIGDVEFADGNNGYIYLNEDYEDEHGGLKGALRRGKRRPMFGATKYVRDWIQYHPDGGDDPDSDAWLFIGNPSHWKTSTDDHWARVGASQVLQRVGEYAGVDKPVNPHNFRHYCATVLYRDYDLDRDTIRMLLGHVEGSSALEKIYSHLFEDDYIRKAEEQLGYREKEERNPLTPETCPTCGEILDEGAKACPGCGNVFAPDAKAAEETIDDQMKESYKHTDPEDANTMEKLDTLDKLLDDPQVKAALLERFEN